MALGVSILGLTACGGQGTETAKVKDAAKDLVKELPKTGEMFFDISLAQWSYIRL